MNKFLMMSTAVAMGTMVAAAADRAIAGTYLTTVHILNSNATFAYCDSFQMYAQNSGRYNARHEFVNCGYSPSWIPNAGEGTKAKPKHFGLGSIEYPVYYGIDEQLVWDFDLPLNKAKNGVPKSKWFVYGSSNGTTQFFINSGYQSSGTDAARVPTKKESGAMKLASILKK